MNENVERWDENKEGAVDDEAHGQDLWQLVVVHGCKQTRSKQEEQRCKMFGWTFQPGQQQRERCDGYRRQQIRQKQAPQQFMAVAERMVGAVDHPKTNRTIKQVGGLHQKVAKGGQWPRVIKSAQKTRACVDTLSLPKQRYATIREVVYLLFYAT
ncbi:hypothetical protein [Shimia sp. NS0008-38b]|uniref:hypothetical protein n=1 Tax=Shimia sp. NS0008-38b TaxID=3127653 RepID=UPI00333F7DE3